MSIATDAIDKGIANLRAAGYAAGDLTERSCLNLVLELRNQVAHAERQAQIRPEGWADAHKQAMAENRCKVFYVDYEFFRQMFDTWQDWGTMALGAFTEDFRDCRVVNCFHSDEHRSFGFVLCHPDWPKCPPGERLERIPNSSNHVFCLKRVSEVFRVPEEHKPQIEERDEYPTIVADPETITRCTREAIAEMKREEERPVFLPGPSGATWHLPKDCDIMDDLAKAYAAIWQYPCCCEPEGVRGNAAEPQPTDNLWSGQPRPEASKCLQCRGSGNHPGITDVCGECGGSGEAKA